MSQEKKFIGSGRSARVFLTSKEGKPAAAKIFTGETTSKVILFILTGSANPYTWCEEAVKTAIIRRKILTELCRYWFGAEVRLPETFGYAWNAEEKAFQIDAEFIPGCHAPLLNPLNEECKNYALELRHKIMEPLQQHLIASGFDGLVWQAGKGNPAAESNFMLLQDGNESYHWVWIDLESGVPAIFALNILSTLTYYLPKCIKHREWLFDTADTKVLKSYVVEKKEELIQALGESDYEELCSDTEELSSAQNAWKSISRFRRGILYSVSQNKITQKQSDYYYNRPLAWYIKSTVNFLLLFFYKTSTALLKVLKWPFGIKYRQLFHHGFQYLTSIRYRWGVARWYFQKDIKKWYARKSLSRDDRKFLLAELHKDDVSSYLTDFSVHLAMKPFDKLLTIIFVPLILAYFELEISTGVILAMAVGPFFRTLYTLWRFTHSLVKRRPHYPVVALVVGLFPLIGNLAYPAELFFRASKNRDYLAKFILYSFSAKIGAKFPLWGGKDSGIEHFFNRWASRLLG